MSLAPAAGKTEIVVAVRGAVDVRDFLLSSPDRLVLDVVGATLGSTTASLYDGVKRGGVLNLRYSQFRPDVVRIVVDLDGPQTYKVDRSGGRRPRVSFGIGRAFQAWSSTTAAGAAPARRRGRGSGRRVAVPARKPEMASGRRAPHSRRRAADHRHLGPRQHRRRGRRLRLLQRPHHHPRQGCEGRGQRRDQEPALAAGLPGHPRHPGPLGPGNAGGIIRVDAPAALAALDSLEPLETSIVRINYAQAASLAKTVESILTKNRGRVVADTGVQRLILTDTRSRIANVTDFVRGLDIAHPAALDPGQDHLRRPDRHRAARHQVRSGQQDPVLQQAGPASGSGQAAANCSARKSTSSTSAAIGVGRRQRRRDITGSALDLVYSTTIGGFSADEAS